MVDFSSLSNLPALPNNGNIILSNGDIINLPPGGLGSMLGGGGKRTEPIWRLKAGQARETFRDGSNKFFLTRTVTRYDASGNVVRDGANKPVRDVEVIGAFGDEITVIPIGYTLNRALGEYLQDTNEYREDCHSEDFFKPDARYAGRVIPNVAPMLVNGTPVQTVATQCATVVNGRITAVCPLAKFSTPKVPGGKSTPPVCKEVYVLAVAVQVDNMPVLNPNDINPKTKQPNPYYDTDQDGNKVVRAVNGYVLAEAYARSSNAKLGKTVVQQISGLATIGKPMYTHTLTFRVEEVPNTSGANTFSGALNVDQLFLEGDESNPEFQEWLEYITDQFAQLNGRWSEALQVRADRAAYIPENRTAAAPQVPEAMAQASSPEPIKRPIHKANGNGSSAADQEILI